MQATYGWTLLGALGMCACAATSALGGSALLKAPIEQQCARYGLRGCAELVDGVLLYVDGDPASAQRIRHAASQNVPADVQRFARAISVVLPAQSSNDILAILTGEESGADSREARNVAEPSPSGGRPFSVAAPSPEVLAVNERAQLSLAAQNDPLRLTTRSVFLSWDTEDAPCQMGGKDVTCVKLGAGPLVITDALTPPGCAKELVIGAANADGDIEWLAPTNSPGFHGARFLVRPDQWVVVASRQTTPRETDDDSCYVTWAGFKPRVWLQNM